MNVMHKVFLLMTAWCLITCSCVQAGTFQDIKAIKTSKEIITIKTVDHIEGTLKCLDQGITDKRCLDWKVSGICIWITCTIFGCDIDESIKVSHYIPDFMVNAHTSNYSPVKELDEINDVQTANLTENHVDDMIYDDPLDFKNAEVFGNPAVIIFNQLGDDSEYFCNSVVDTPFYPYYLSGLDTFWNSPSFEHWYPQAIIGIPAIKAVLPLSYWSQIYPLSGWGRHPYDAINAAVAAYRSAVITVNNEPHIHLDPGTDCGYMCWAPGDIENGSSSSHKFQMIFPSLEENGKAFGGSASWANGKSNVSDGYSWSLWRPYSCCDPAGAAFVTSIDFQ